MKLIIDIPEDVVTEIQNGQDYRYDIHTAIAQGKPCDTSGDLISRNALKEALSKRLWFVSSPECDAQEIKEVIDNAPTVEPCYQTTSCLSCQMYDKEKRHCPRFCEVIRSAVEEVKENENT